jgi:hypothetical protein
MNKHHCCGSVMDNFFAIITLLVDTPEWLEMDVAYFPAPYTGQAFVEKKE